jgi:hypothetical protein
MFFGIFFSELVKKTFAKILLKNSSKFCLKIDQNSA